MTEKLQWEKVGDALMIQGELDQTSSPSLWQAMQHQMRTFSTIDVSDVSRADSAGLAMLVYFLTHYDVQLVGMTPNLLTLIQLYHLEEVIKPL